MEYRIERDTLGEMRVPKDALWGPQTQRAVENFPISGSPMPKEFIRALGLVKMAAARVNRRLGHLDPKISEAIEEAARSVFEGKLDSEFPVDVFQTGSGTSSNMNANEVIATLASRRVGQKVHPNDHVNMGQSSNDVVPTALHVAAVLKIERELLPSLRTLHRALLSKSQEFDRVVKIGRTHLMDAVPVRLGQEFSGYARQVELSIERIEATLPHLRELAVGGTAVGTGLNTHPRFGELMAREISDLAGTTFYEARNHFEAQGAQDSAAWTAATLSVVASSLMKIANDIRLLASGPQAGLGEILLPPLQPGSSIMPGKVNPVLCESVVQVSAQVVGNSHAVLLAAQGGHLELNTMLPLATRNLLESIELLSRVSRVFAEKCIAGIQANEERCRDFIEKSVSMATPLAPLLGYEKAAEIAKEALRTGRSVREVAYERSGLPREKIDELLDPYRQTEAGGEKGGGG